MIGFLLPIATFSFALGLTLPLMKLERLYFLEETPSLLEITGALYEEGELLISGAILIFSIVLPAIKLLVLHVAAVGHENRWALRLMITLGKWSMMDVMLVALVIFAAKTSGLASASSLPGLWFYAVATLFSAVSALACQYMRR
nr:paraquat-inducible protein A [Pseudovibrio flavus]